MKDTTNNALRAPGRSWLVEAPDPSRGGAR